MENWNWNYWIDKNWRYFCKYLIYQKIFFYFKGNGTALKRVVKKSLINGKPEKSCKIFFDYKICVEEKEIYASCSDFLDISEE